MGSELKVAQDEAQACLARLHLAQREHDELLSKLIGKTTELDAAERHLEEAEAKVRALRAKPRHLGLVGMPREGAA